MWLHVANTNNDPRVIAKHFIDCVRMVGGILSLSSLIPYFLE